MRIMFLGQQRAGKDTAADFLVQQHGFVKIPLAKPLYWVARFLFDMQEKDRGLLIQLGKKLREVDEDVFIKWVLKQAEDYAHVVIPDVRFPNEYKKLREAGFIPVRIEASRYLRAQRPGYNPEFEDHPTEHLLDDYYVEAVIKNEGDFTELYCRLNSLLEDLSFFEKPRNTVNTKR